MPLQGYIFYYSIATAITRSRKQEPVQRKVWEDRIGRRSATILTLLIISAIKASGGVLRAIASRRRAGTGSGMQTGNRYPYNTLNNKLLRKGEYKKIPV